MLDRLMQLGIAGFLLSACVSSEIPLSAHQHLEDEVRQAATDLSMEGVAYAVISNGETVASANIQVGDRALTVESPLRFASVTKALTGIILAKLATDGSIDVDAPANDYLTSRVLSPDVTVRHLASHTSEGIVGEEFVYGTNRFALLEEIIETATSKSFDTVLSDVIAQPAGMAEFDSPFLGSHAGYVSTVTEMAKMAAALERGRLLARRGLKTISTPSPLNNGEPGPVSLGWFVDEIAGERVLWSFGQDDPDHSSALVIYLPRRELALVMLANTDELSNPFRLLIGDVTVSPFALAFLDSFAPALGEQVSPQSRTISHALAAIWVEDYEEAVGAYESIKRENPDAFDDHDDLVLHFLATSAEQDQSELVDNFDDSVLENHPLNRWVLLNSADYRAKTGRAHEASLRYQRIIDLPQQEDDFLRRLFLAWSYGGQAKVLAQTDPAGAIDLVDQALATGVTGRTADDLRDLRRTFAAN